MPLGVLAAVRRGSIIDQVVRVIGLIGYSVPIFWLALMALVLFYAKLDWVAGPGRIDVAYEYTFTPITGFFLLDSAWQGAVGCLLGRLPPHHPAGLAARLFLARLYQPHDALASC